MQKKLLLISLSLGLLSINPQGLNKTNKVNAAVGIIMNDTFSDNMILQRDSNVEIYGETGSNEDVIVTFNNQEKKTKADENGKFSVYLDKMGANAVGQTLIIKSNSATKRIYNVLVGDVYYGSGQSNMAYYVDEFTYAETLIKNNPEYGDDYLKYQSQPSFLEKLNEFKHYELLRFYTQYQLPITAATPNKGVTNAWISPSGVSDLQYVSLTAITFAMNLSASLDNVPVGIIVSAVGGSQLHEWISKEDANIIYPNNGNPTISQRHDNMFIKMGRYTIKGALWYQGESDVYGSLDKYKESFVAYCKEIRSFFNNASLPIITFQLPQFEDSGCKGLWAPFRKIQEELANEIDNVYYVCGIDLGDHTNIHPCDKYEFTSRAVGVALKYIYNVNTTCNNHYGLSPTVDKIYQKNQSSDTYLTFNNANEIKISDGNRSGLIATTNKQSYANVKEYEKVGSKYIKFTSKHKYFSYLQENIFSYDTAFIYNEYDLPVAPFTLKEVIKYDYDVVINTTNCKVNEGDHFFINNNDSLLLTITPNENTSLVNVLVNGKEEKITDFTLTLDNINCDTIIEINYKTNENPPIDNPSVEPSVEPSSELSAEPSSTPSVTPSSSEIEISSTNTSSNEEKTNENKKGCKGNITFKLIPLLALIIIGLLKKKKHI